MTDEAAETQTQTPAPAKVKKLTVELLYDYWDENEERQFAGSKIKLPEDMAIDIVNEGKAKLVKN